MKNSQEKKKEYVKLTVRDMCRSKKMDSAGGEYK